MCIALLDTYSLGILQKQMVGHRLLPSRSSGDGLYYLCMHSYSLLIGLKNAPTLLSCARALSAFLCLHLVMPHTQDPSSSVGLLSMNHTQNDRHALISTKCLNNSVCPTRYE